jgi:HEAT repeat protein
MQKIFRTFFQSLFNIRPGEGFRVGLMFLYSLAAIGGVIILGRSVSRALFLSALPESAIPLKFILPPIFVVLVVSLYTRIAPRFRLHRLIMITNLLMIAGILVFRFLLEFPFASGLVFLAALFVYFELMVSLVGIQFWTFAGEIFNPREAKRLFSLIAAGGVLANALAGAGLRLLASFVQPKDLTLVVAASLLFGTACVRALGRRQEMAELTQTTVQRPRQRIESGGSTLWRDLQALRRSPLLVTIGSIMIVMSLVTNLADFQLDLSLQRFFSADGQSMLTFLGTFSFWTGIAAILLQIFATSRILEKMGLLMGLLMLPIGMALGSTVFLVAGGALWSIALPRGADFLLRYTVSDASLNVLFLPVRSDLRRRAKAILDGIVKPPMIALLGLMLPLFIRADIDATGVRSADVIPWSVVIMGLIGIWAFLIIRVRRQYVSTLSESLSSHRLSLDESELDVSEETTVRVLVDHLGEENPAEVIHALQLIDHADRVNWIPHVLPLLDHPSAAVRLLAVQHLEQNHHKHENPLGYAMELARRFNDPDPRVQGASIEAYCALRGAEVIQEVASFLDSPQLETQGSAIVGLMRHAGLDGIVEAAVFLKQLWTADSVEKRQAGAKILGKLGIQNFYQPLIPMLDDVSEAVNISALKAAGSIRHPALVPHMIKKLALSATAAPARDALVRFGPGIEPLLEQVLASEQQLQIRIEVPKILRQIGTTASAEALLSHVSEENDHVRGSVYKALARLHTNRVPIPVERSAIDVAIEDELRRTFTLFTVRYDILNSGDGNLLVQALTERLNYTLDRLFFLFTLIYPGQDMQTVREALDSDDQRLRANAIELLDSFADREIKGLLLPLVEAPDNKILSLAEQQLQVTSRSEEERLHELAQHSDRWLQACALYNIGTQGLDSLIDTVTAAVEADDAVVAETALWACQRLLDSEQFDVLLASLDLERGRFHGGSYTQGLLNKEYPMALSTVERVFHLQNVELFDRVSSEDLVSVAQLCQEVHFEPGEQIITAGDIGDCLYVIVAGEVEVELAGTETGITRISEDIIGEMAIISRNPRSANCIAESSVTALSIGYEDFWALMEDKPALALGVMKVLTQRLDRLNKQVQEHLEAHH